MASSLDEEDLATHGRDAWAKFNVAYETFRKNGSTFSGQPDAAAFRAEMQRFQLWAINLGLYRQDHGSLDYRLRDNEVVKSFTRELLRSLIEALIEITTIAGHGDEESPSIVSETLDLDVVRPESEEPLGIFNDGGSSTSSIMMGALNDEDESMVTLHFEDVTEAINQLYNLASQIRSPKIRKYRTDVDLFEEVDDEIKSEYIKMRKRSELHGIEQILLQSRKLLIQSQPEETDLVLTEEDQYLIQRLQKANHARRQQFEYWRRSKKRSIRAASKAIQAMPISIHCDDRLMHDTLSFAQPSELTRSLLSSAPALSRNFVLERKGSTYTGTSRGLTVHGPSGEKVNWPKPPVAGPRGEDFECPFCFYFCGSKYSEDAAWRSHLRHDLRPYVCTYEECTEPNVLYDSWEEWARHEQWAHQQRIWRCSEHPQHEYVELASYEDHVRTCHVASMQQLLSSELLKSRESVSQVCDRPCPFCQREFERPIDLQQHIAGHLESTALLSLPNLDDMDENSEAGQVNSASADRNNAESRAGDFDRTESLVFLDKGHSEDLSIATETDKELFGLKLKAESSSFEVMNEVNVEARQAYSSELSGGWLSRLPHEFSEEDGSHFPPPESSSVMGSDLIGDLHAVLQLCWKVHEECKSLPDDYAELSSGVGTLYIVMKQTEELLSQRNLTAKQDIELIAYRQESKDVLMDLDKTIGIVENIETEASLSLLLGLGYIEPIRSRLISNVSMLDAFNNSFSQEVGDEEASENSSTSELGFESGNPGDEQLRSSQHEAFPAHQGTASGNHWLPDVFNQSHPTTPLRDTGQSSMIFAKYEPGIEASLDEAYVTLTELPFESVDLILQVLQRPETGESMFERGDLILRVLQRPETGESMFECRKIRPVGSRQVCAIELSSLTVSRSGPFLGFYRFDQPETPKLWARFKFHSYEGGPRSDSPRVSVNRLTENQGMVLFFCSFLALRFRDNITDFGIDKEEPIFAGRIFDDGYEHALRLFREKDTGVIRLQATVRSGGLRSAPAWTAFITHQMRVPGWATRNSPKIVLLADIQQFIFTTEYNPQKTSSGAFELAFIESRDARDFVTCLKEVGGMPIDESDDT